MVMHKLFLLQVDFLAWNHRFSNIILPQHSAVGIPNTCLICFYFSWCLLADIQYIPLLDMFDQCLYCLLPAISIICPSQCCWWWELMPYFRWFFSAIMLLPTFWILLFTGSTSMWPSCSFPLLLPVPNDKIYCLTWLGCRGAIQVHKCACVWTNCSKYIGNKHQNDNKIIIIIWHPFCLKPTMLLLSANSGLTICLHYGCQ